MSVLFVSQTFYLASAQIQLFVGTYVELSGLPAFGDSLEGGPANFAAICIWLIEECANGAIDLAKVLILLVTSAAEHWMVSLVAVTKDFY